MIKLLVFLAACSFSALFYRLGGTSAGTKWRDVGCPFILLVTVVTLFGFSLTQWWIYPIVFFLSMGALSTYRYFLPKPKDYLWYHYSFHGLMCGLAGIPLLWCGVPLWVLILRTIVLTLGMGVWSMFISWLSKKLPWKHWDKINEGGRGVLFIL